jgi:hypothetical protein
MKFNKVKAEAKPMLKFEEEEPDIEDIEEDDEDWEEEEE